MDDKLFVECMCGHSVLRVAWDEWDEYTIYASLIVYGEHTPGWKDRLCHAWSIVRYGHPWGATEVLMKESDALRVGKLLRREE